MLCSSAGLVCYQQVVLNWGFPSGYFGGPENNKSISKSCSHVSVWPRDNFPFKLSSCCSSAQQMLTSHQLDKRNKFISLAAFYFRPPNSKVKIRMHFCVTKTTRYVWWKKKICINGPCPALLRLLVVFKPQNGNQIIKVLHYSNDTSLLLVNGVCVHHELSFSFNLNLFFSMNSSDHTPPFPHSNVWQEDPIKTGLATKSHIL